MQNKPEGATHYAKHNDCFYKVSSDKPDDWALYICAKFGGEWDVSEHWENEDLDIDTEFFEKV